MPRNDDNKGVFTFYYVEHARSPFHYVDGRGIVARRGQGPHLNPYPGEDTAEFYDLRGAVRDHQLIRAIEDKREKAKKLAVSRVKEGKKDVVLSKITIPKTGTREARFRRLSSLGPFLELSRKNSKSDEVVFFGRIPEKYIEKTTQVPLTQEVNPDEVPSRSLPSCRCRSRARTARAFF